MWPTQRLLYVLNIYLYLLNTSYSSDWVKLLFNIETKNISTHFVTQSGLKDLQPQQWWTPKQHVCLREMTSLQLQLLSALTRESADAPQLDYFWLVTLYLFIISLCLHSAASFKLPLISVWLGRVFNGGPDVVPWQTEKLYLTVTSSGLRTWEEAAFSSKTPLKAFHYFITNRPAFDQKQQLPVCEPLMCVQWLKMTFYWRWKIQDSDSPTNYQEGYNYM